MSHATHVPYELFVGIDSAARTATASWLHTAQRPTRPLTFEQSADGYQRLLAQVQATAVA